MTEAWLESITEAREMQEELRSHVVARDVLGEIERVVKEGARSGRPLYELDVELLERLGPDLVRAQVVCDVCAVGEGQALAQASMARLI